MKTVVIESMARAGDADVEPIILEWSKAGVFDSAATEAIEQAHQQGQAVTIVEEGIVYRFFPDGSKLELRRNNRKRTTYSTGIAYIQ